MTDTLWQRVEQVSRQALASGALQSIPTAAQVVEEYGLQFLIRVLDNLKRKDEARQRLQQAGDTRRNPFLPYEQALYVGDLGRRHVCLLNKFNVVDHHLLIVTRDFESQRNRLNLDDFSALAECLRQIDGLGFYNGGTLAGASQPHKHLQLLPLPMAPFAALPFSPVLDRLQPDAPQQRPELAFQHAGLALPEGLWTTPEQAGQTLLTQYDTLCQVLGIGAAGEQVTSDYNLLVTRRWMLMVPRYHEGFEGISFNALAFTGALLVRQPEEAQRLRQRGLMHALRSVTE